MKNKKMTLIFIVLLIILTTSCVPKTFQNDTFFAIAIGDLISDNGIDMMEHFTWHEGLTYCYSHWLFDIIISVINNLWGFVGIYIFTIVMANITTITLFNVLRKRENNEIICFAITIFTLYLGKSMFTGRAQIISFVLFILEVYFIEQFLKKPKKIYILFLLIIPIIIANVHAAVWPMYFVMYLPYIAEYILSQLTLQKKYERKKKKAIKKLENKNISNKEKIKYEEILEKSRQFSNKDNTSYNITIEENENTKKLIIIMLIAIITGFITPIGNTPFVYMIRQMENNIVGSFVSEMKPIIPVENVNFIILIVIYLLLFTNKNIKIKASDLLFILGFIFMTIYTVRSIFYLIWICAMPLTKIINDFVFKYGEKELESIENQLEKSNRIFILILVASSISIYSYLTLNLNSEYVDKRMYPVEASKYILNNLDVHSIKLYNGYNYGSYLEMEGIPVFIDSRADIYCKEFNDTTILEDERNLLTGTKNYSEIFNKYGITHVLLKKENIIDVYMSKDINYKSIYEDEFWVLYRKK